MNPYKFYVFESAADYISNRMAADILFRTLKSDIQEDQLYVLRRVVEGREIFWLVCHLDGEKSVCIGSKADMMEFSRELRDNPESAHTGNKIAEVMARQARSNPDRGYRVSIV